MVAETAMAVDMDTAVGMDTAVAMDSAVDMAAETVAGAVMARAPVMAIPTIGDGSMETIRSGNGSPPKQIRLCGIPATGNRQGAWDLRVFGIGMKLHRRVAR